MSVPERSHQSSGATPIPEVSVSLTLHEIRGLRMALIFGVPAREPDEIVSARAKLNAAERVIASTSKESR